jgi:hypothetical protein
MTSYLDKPRRDPVRLNLTSRSKALDQSSLVTLQGWPGTTDPRRSSLPMECPDSHLVYSSGRAPTLLDIQSLAGERLQYTTLELPTQAFPVRVNYGAIS